MKQLLTGLIKLTAASILVISISACGGAEERKLKYLEKGKAYLAEKNYEKARIELKNVLQIDPKNAEAYYLMGNIRENDKEISKAIGAYRKSIELDPEHVKAKVSLSKLYLIVNTEEYIQKSKDLLAEVQKSDPDNRDAALIKATIEYKTGDKDKAIADIEKLVQSNPDLTDGISLLAALYVQNKAHEKAISVLEKGVNDNPENINIRISLAKLLSAKNDLEGAEKYLKEAISLEPKNYSHRLALSSFYSTSKQYDKAEKVLREAIKDDENDPKRYLVLVEFLSVARSIQLAEDEMNNIVQTKPDLYELKFAQVVFFEKINKKEQAKAVLRKIVEDREFDPEGVKARIMLADYDLKDGRIKSAGETIDKVLVEYPNNNDALMIAGKIALAKRDAITAISNLRTVVKNDPGNPEATLLLAQAHELNNESSLAETELKKAIESNPTNDQMHINYAIYLASKGRSEEALDSVDKALTYFKDSYELMNIKLRLIAGKASEQELLDLMNLMQQTNPAKPEVYLTKGQYYLSKREIDKAIEQFEKAFNTANNKYPALESIVKAYVIKKQPEQAMLKLDSILAKDENDAAANYLKATVYLMQKKHDEAKKYLKKSIASANKWFKPYATLATVYLSDNNINEAIAVYRNAESNLDNKVPAQLQIAALYERDKKYSDAIKVYDEIIKSNPLNTIAANNYAALLLDYGQESDVSLALELTKDFEKLSQPALLDTLAWALTKSGNHAKAIELLKGIVEKIPNAAVIQYHLGYALYHSGDKQAAKPYLEMAATSDQKYAGKDNAKKLLESL